ncbi:ferritin heavy chain [Schistocerca gregaria]|uniref:Ferritin n=1 Tax=Schistocerca gregaria TaxID=7010 RepID=A0A8E5JT45_SCHGR|nr:ferritin heavy chain [Schistocerca gregaria]QVD39393.1 Ferritin heavy subunit [Schistocerca gregaria]
MKVFGVFICLLSAAFASQFCYDSKICSGRDDFTTCTAKYGEFPAIESELSRYMNVHFNHSYQYLLLSSYFKNFEKNRHGFEKLYRKLSDEMWEQSIDLIKYVTKRGGAVKFDPIPRKLDFPSDNLNLNEMESLAVALDGQKLLANEANEIHRRVTKNVVHHSEPSLAAHDAEVGSYLENEFVHKLAERIRDLSGYANDLIKLLAEDKQPERSLSLYLFDEYLQKAL